MNAVKQQGFLLPAAIFLLVVLGALGAYAVNLSVAQNVSSMQDVQGARAYQMARAGAEWAAYQVMEPATATLGNCPSSGTVFNLEGFTVTVNCTRSADYYQRGGDHTIALYRIMATAQTGTVSTPNYIERQVVIDLSKCRGTDTATPYQC